MVISIVKLVEQAADPLSIPPAPAVWIASEPLDETPDACSSWSFWLSLTLAGPVAWGLCWALLWGDPTPLIPLGIGAGLVCVAVALRRWR